MQNRREFLQAAFGGVALAATGALGGEPEKKGINDTLKAIAEKLRGVSEGAKIEERFVENPDTGLVQWRWMHFCRGLTKEQCPELERINEELLTGMQSVYELPESGLDHLMHEGLVEGRVADQMEGYRAIHRELIERKFTTVIPFGVGQDIAPSRERVDEELNVLRNMQSPVYQIVRFGREQRQVRLSTLARLGAGYSLASQKKIELLAAEDPELDAKAEWAEQWGTKEEYEQHVMTARDAHFVKLVRQAKLRIVHLLVGAAHDLTDDIAGGKEEYGENISHLIVSTKGVTEMKLR